MSNLAMTQSEEKSIDSKVEQMMDWAQSRQIEAEQLALDSARLMACTTDRLDRLSKQGFYKRCWSRFNGDANAMERANVNDVIQMQKMAFRYVNMLQEQQLLMAHSLLSLKNNLNSLAVREEETRNLIAMLAQRTLERFEQLEGRVGKLETSSNLHDWLFTLEERDYEEKIPTDYMRLLRIINDFYEIKNDNWNNNDLMFMRKAIRTVGLNPKQKVSINTFIDKLTDEIQGNEVGFDAYEKSLTMFAPEGIDNYSQFAIENVSSPVFASLHGLNTHYRDKMDAVEALQDSLSISASDALKTLLRNSIKNMNVNLDYEFPLAETAIEILGSIRLAEKLIIPIQEEKVSDKALEIEEINSEKDIFVDIIDDTNTKADFFDATIRKLDCLDTTAILNNKFVYTPRVQAGKLPINLGEIYKKITGGVDNKGLLGTTDGVYIFVMVFGLDENDEYSEMECFTIFDILNGKYAIIGEEDKDIDEVISKWDPKYRDELEAKLDSFMSKLLNEKENTEKQGIQEDDTPNTQTNECDNHYGDKMANSKAKHEELILSHFINISSDNNVYIRGRQNSEKVYNKLQNGISAFGMFTDEEDVLVYYDSSVFGGGGEGFILTHDSIFYKCSGNDDFTSYDNVERVISSWGGFKLDLGYETSSITCTDGKVRDAAISAIRAMKAKLDTE